MAKGYVLAASDSPFVEGLFTYYQGKTYRVAGEDYAAVCKKEHARVYKTRSGAQKAVDALEKKVWNYQFVVHEKEEQV